MHMQIQVCCQSVVCSYQAPRDQVDDKKNGVAFSTTRGEGGKHDNELYSIMWLSCFYIVAAVLVQQVLRHSGVQSGTSLGYGGQASVVGAVGGIMSVYRTLKMNNAVTIETPIPIGSFSTT